MNILMVIGSLGFGGAERVMSSVAGYLADRHRIKICTLHQLPIAYPLDERVSLVEGIAADGVPGAIRSIRKEAKSFHADIVLSFLTHVNITTITAMMGTGIPVVVSERNDPRAENNKKRVLLRAITYPFARGFAFQTNGAKQYFSAAIQNRSEVIPNPVFVDDIPLLDPEQVRRKKVFSAVGRLNEQKNYPMMLHAFAKVMQKYPEFHLNVFGDGELREQTEQLCKELGIASNVHLMGAVKDVHSRIQNSHAFLMTSDYEGMPNALMEALAMGLCCISTDCPCGGPDELTRSGERGILVPVGDDQALAAEMIRVIEQPERAAQFRKKAQAVRTDYALSKIGDQWERFLLKVAGKKA